MKHSIEENVYKAHFKIFKTLPNIYGVINAKLGQKGLEFVHYVPAVIERSNSSTLQYLRRATSLT